MGTEVAEKRTTQRYSEAERQRALVEVAACSGNTYKAARHLAAEGLGIDQKTLWRWSRREMVEDYERIRVEILPQITAQATEAHMALARQQMALSQEAAALVAARLPGMENKDLVNAMGKADIGSGIHTEKAQLLSGAPTQIIKRDASGVLRKLQSRGVVVLDAEVVGEEDVTEIGSG